MAELATAADGGADVWHTCGSGQDLPPINQINCKYEREHAEQRLAEHDGDCT